MTTEQTEVLDKLKEIEEQMDRLLDEMADAPGLMRSRILHARSLSRYLRTTIGPETLTVQENQQPLVRHSYRVMTYPL